MMLSGMKTTQGQQINSTSYWKQPLLLCVFIHVLTLHLHHVNRNLLLSHAEDFKVGNNALKKQN